MFLLPLFIPKLVSARIGVGIGSGKIKVETKLKPGIMYELPPLTVINTGDEASDYEVSVTYHQNQPEMAPAEEWFKFSPRRFNLEPGEAQVVAIRVDLPIKTIPGNYFAYLEGHPIKSSQAGATTIGVAAAAKLYFTVLPANFITGVYYRAVSLWKMYQPWTNIIAAILSFFLIVFIFTRFFKINISLNKQGDRQR